MMPLFNKPNSSQINTRFLVELNYLNSNKVSVHTYAIVLESTPKQQLDTKSNMSFCLLESVEVAGVIHDSDSAEFNLLSNLRDCSSYQIDYI